MSRDRPVRTMKPPSAGQSGHSWAKAIPRRRGPWPDLTGTRQRRRDGFIDHWSGTAMQPTPRDEQKRTLPLYGRLLKNPER